VIFAYILKPKEYKVHKKGKSDINTYGIYSF